MADLENHLKKINNSTVNHFNIHEENKKKNQFCSKYKMAVIIQDGVKSAFFILALFKKIAFSSDTVL
jgi:hypothetical protein